MRAAFRLGSLFGIAIFVHYSWFVIFALVTFSLIAHFAGQFPDLPSQAHWVMGLVASGLFFSSVLIHEMAHSLVATRRGCRVKAITLFVFGGVAEIEKEPERPETEILVAAVGPLASFLLGLFYGSIWLLSHDSMPAIGSVAGWLGAVNIGLGVFNLLPGLPLDGGRLLRGISWLLSGNQERATRIAAASGTVIGYLIILFGALLAFGQKNWVNGLWLLFIGWFLVNAAEMSMTQMRFQRAMAGVKAAEIMTTDCSFVPAGESLADFVEHFLMRRSANCFIVGDQSSPKGIITIADVRAVPHDEWCRTSVQAAMRPLERLFFVSPDSDVEDVLRLMDTKDVAQVPVMRNGQLLGMIGRDDLLSLIRNRLALAA
jgi:Zn-dependent protease